MATGRIEGERIHCGAAYWHCRHAYTTGWGEHVWRWRLYLTVL